MKYYKSILIIFGLALVFYALFSTQVTFHDVFEYITLAKNFAGINNLDLFTTHSLLYPFIISPFLKIWPAITMIKLVNCLWLFLIGLILFFGFEDKRIFLLYIFSPLVWYTSIQTTPILPATLFLLLAYLFFKKIDSKYCLFFSGTALGFACALYDPVIIVALIFLLVYFLDKKFSIFISYVIFMGFGFLPRMILDYTLFHMPFYSLIRFLGTNAIVALGLNPATKNINFSIIGVLSMVFLISPLLFKIYQINFKDYKKDLIFLLISGLLLMIRCVMPKYFLLIAPIALILLSRILTKREVFWHCIFSLIIVISLTSGYFTYTQDTLVANDLNKIVSDYNSTWIIAGPFQANNFAAFLWNDNPRVAWLEDYSASQANQTYLKAYNFGFNSKIPLRENIVFGATFNRFENKNYSNYILVTQKDSNPSSFKLEKCYKVLCVYK